MKEQKPGEGTEKPGEGVEKPNLPEKGQGSSNNQQLPATGHNTNYVPFIGFMLLLLGIRLRFMAKIVKRCIKASEIIQSLMPFK